MKQWIDQTQLLIDWVTEAEQALRTIKQLISAEKSPIERLWYIALVESMPEGLTLERVRMSLTALRVQLTTLVKSMRKYD